MAALALVKNDVIVPPRSLVAGNPARIIKQFEPQQITWRNDGDGEYQRLAREMLLGCVEVSPLPQAEPDRARMRSNAIPVRLHGPAAHARQRRAAAQSGEQPS